MQFSIIIASFIAVAAAAPIGTRDAHSAVGTYFYQNGNPGVSVSFKEQN